MKWSKTKQGAWVCHNWRIIKPTDKYHLQRVAGEHELLITVIGIFSSAVKAKHVAELIEQG